MMSGNSRRRMFTLIVITAAILSGCIVNQSPLGADTTQSDSGEVLLESSALTVRIQSNDATLRVRVKASGNEWDQPPLGKFRCSQVKKLTSSSAEMTLEGSVPAKVKITLLEKEPSFRMELLPASDTRLPESLDYPYPFLINPDEGYQVLPYREGVLIPLNDYRHIKTFKKYEGMWWYGVTDLQRGYLAIMETPADVLLKRATGDYLGKRFIFYPFCWRPSFGKLSYPRKVLYHFEDSGGYVGLCKYYRDYRLKQGGLTTTEQKAARNPNMKKLKGTIFLWGHRKFAQSQFPEAEWDNFLDQLKGSGIENALIGINPGTAIGSRDTTPPGGLEHFLVRAKEKGYLTTRFTDLAAHIMEQMIDGQRHSLDRFAESAIKNSAGQHQKGGMGTFSCALPVYGYLERCIDSELERHPYTCWYIDKFLGTSQLECYAPAHRTSRHEQMDALIRLCKLITNDKGLILTMEGGDERLLPYLSVSMSNLTLNYRDKSMLHGSKEYGLRKPVDRVGPSYERYAMGEYYRVPLFELVYHDMIINTWHWEADYNNLVWEYWVKHDLFNILYGTPPLISFQDLDFFSGNKSKILRSYEHVSGWHGTVGWAEMESHRFLTPDRSVQESRFDNGWGVLVNFGSSPFDSAQGQVPPLGYRTFNWKNPKQMGKAYGYPADEYRGGELPRVKEEKRPRRPKKPPKRPRRPYR